MDHKFSDKDNLYASGYYSHDHFYFDSNERYSYTNANGSLKWRHVFPNRMTGTFTGGYDHYDYLTKTEENPAEAYRLRFGINQIFGKLDFTYYLNEKHTVDFGGGTTYYRLNPGENLPNHPESLVAPDKLQTEQAIETYLYLADRWEINDQLSVSAGLRYMMFNSMGPRTYPSMILLYYPVKEQRQRLKPSTFFVLSRPIMPQKSDYPPVMLSVMTSLSKLDSILYNRIYTNCRILPSCRLPTLGN